MESEIKDKSSKNCDTDDSSIDSSALNNNNVKESVKKVLEVNNIDEDDSAIDKDEENDKESSSEKSSETKNGVQAESKDNENQKTDTETNSENAALNCEQNNVDDSLSDTLNNKDSDNTMECEESSEKMSDEQEKNGKSVLSTSGHSEDSKKESESNGQPTDIEEPMDVDVLPEEDSSKKEKTVVSESESAKDNVHSESAIDNVRPAEKDSSVSPEKVQPESSVTSKSSKSDSSDKETKDAPDSEVANETASSKENKSKETSVSTSTESKTDSSTSADSKTESSASADTKTESSASVDTKTENNTPVESKPESTKKEGEGKKKKRKTCEECGEKKGLKFQVLFKGKTRFLCSDTCFKNFKTKQMQSKASTEPPAPKPAPETPSEKCAQCQKNFSGDQKFYPVVGDTKALCSEDCMKKYHTDNMPPKNCSQCKKVIENTQNPDILTWETMVFCNDDCLGKYQSYLGSHCTCCQSPVPQASLGKYSVCFGADIRQFCSCGCLDDYKKNLKVCSFCQTDLSSGSDSFLAPVGDKGQFKDFCSQNCMERYETMNNLSKNGPQTQVCSHCKKQGAFKIQVKHDNQTYALCSDMCVAGFRCSHTIKDKMCHTCFNFFDMSPEKDKEFSFKFDGQIKQFCTKACMTLFVLSHRKIVACVSCKVKKYNFDMIEKLDASNQLQIFCSLNCLSLYRVSVNATSSKSVRCDNCTKNLPAQYHLTMSDGSVRNFCTYNCVILFQNQYTNVCTITTTSTTRQTSSTASTSTSKTSAATSTPVISNVVSLAPGTPRAPGAPTLIRNIVPPKLVSARPSLQPVAIIGSKIFSLAPSTRVVRPVLTQNPVPSKQDADQQLLSTHLASSDSKSASSTITSPSPLTTITNASGQQVIREVIVKPSAPKSQKNKCVACKPIMQHKGINVKPQPCHKAVQTDDSPRPILLPVPVPYYVPVPVHMFSRPVPCPMPFPVPMFVPIVLPPKDVLNQERKISGSGEKSLEKKPEDSCNSIKDTSKEESNSQNEKDKSNKEDGQPSSYPMKIDEPSSSATSDEYNDMNEYDEDEYTFQDGKNHHHGKRHSHHKSKGRKKIRMDDAIMEDSKTHNTVSADDNRNSTVQNDHLEPVPRLKHTFGVNAWKQWVLQKNEQLERGSHSSRKFKLFKTDLLQLPPDELNYSLSLFVKEVRKPNGEEYGSGSIYYLCLGIQKYLFQNGRIDNIFSDPYYEKFTECLHDILLSQDELNLLEGFPASRIEEEVLWEAKQLGAHSPYALLNTVMYFNTKYFKLKKIEDHVRLSFNHMLTVFDRKSTDRPDKIGVLRYYPTGRKCEYAECSHNSNICVDGPRKDPSENKYKEIDNAVDSLRCPVRLFEFYLSKCSENCKGRSDMFYLYPERSCVPDSAVWYSLQPLGSDVVSKMMQRIKLIREIYDG